MKRYPRRALLIPAVLVAAVWYLLYLHPARRDDPWYAAIGLGVGLVSLIAVIYQLVRTTSWTIRAMGVLGYVVGGAVFYLSVAQHEWYPINAGWHEGVIDLSAAVLVICGPLLLWGMVETTVDDRREADDPDIGASGTFTHYHEDDNVPGLP